MIFFLLSLMKGEIGFVNNKKICKLIPSSQRTASIKIIWIQTYFLVDYKNLVNRMFCPIIGQADSQFDRSSIVLTTCLHRTPYSSLRSQNDRSFLCLKSKSEG